MARQIKHRRRRLLLLPALLLVYIVGWPLYWCGDNSSSQKNRCRSNGGAGVNQFLRAWRHFRCRCKYKKVCGSFQPEGVVCFTEASRYCGKFRLLEDDFEAALIKQFGLAIDVISWGRCVIILGPCFTRGWRRLLHDREYDVHFDYLDDRLVVFVPLKQQEANS